MAPFKSIAAPFCSSATPWFAAPFYVQGFLGHGSTWEGGASSRGVVPESTGAVQCTISPTHNPTTINTVVSVLGWQTLIVNFQFSDNHVAIRALLGDGANQRQCVHGQSTVCQLLFRSTIQRTMYRLTGDSDQRCVHVFQDAELCCIGDYIGRAAL